MFLFPCWIIGAVVIVFFSHSEDSIFSPIIPNYVTFAICSHFILWWYKTVVAIVFRIPSKVSWLIFPEAGDARQHECQLCGRTYKRRHHLVRHLRYECGPARKQQQCAICGKRYSRPDTLQEHYVLYHRACRIWSICLLGCRRLFGTVPCKDTRMHNFMICLVRWMYFILDVHVAESLIFKFWSLGLEWI